MGKLVVSRKYDSAGLFRKMTVTLDGEPVARLKPDRSTEVEVVDNGTHVIQAKMDWATSEPREFETSSNSVTQVQVALKMEDFFAVFFRPKSSINISVKSNE